MSALSPLDSSRLQSAQECLRAGKHPEARAALEAMSAQSRELPEALEALWETHARFGEWDLALETAKRLCQIVTDSESPWLCHACSLSELQRTPEAFDVLLAAAEKFPEAPTVAYNLACCACKLGRLKEASRWIGKAIELGGRAEVKLIALDDPDLAPLLDEICAM